MWLFEGDVGGVIVGIKRISDKGFHLVCRGKDVVLMYGRWNLLYVMRGGGKVQLAEGIDLKMFDVDERGRLLVVED